MRLLVLILCALVPQSDLGWVETRVAEWQMKPSERKFDRIGWLTDIRAALELGKKSNRPLFLFTHDGRMAIGRC
ncbi:MAG TPA: hypothetical protein VJB14_12630 [Planctomycetota bacterium]|nr:hypothetical protein [Planctomycetota bacterium]